MAQFETVAEREVAGGWAFTIQTLDDEGRLSSHEVRLSWADYNLWSGDGSDEPTQVIEAVMAFLLKNLSVQDLPEKFDASWARRNFADADQTIPGLIG